MFQFLYNDDQSWAGKTDQLTILQNTAHTLAPRPVPHTRGSFCGVVWADIGEFPSNTHIIQLDNDCPVYRVTM